MEEPIYRFDPDLAPDAEYVAGELRHVVCGNRARLLDSRRTPVSITAVRPATGSFEVRIEAFEDRGAHWELSLQEIHRFQFPRAGGAEARHDVVAELQRSIERFDRPLVIPVDPGRRADTAERIRAEQATIARRLFSSPPPAGNLSDHIRDRAGSDALAAQLDAYLAERDLYELDRRFAATFVGNPASGETVKAHAIVLAELGVVAFNGRVVRDPGVFAGPSSKQRRAEHLITRLAFTRALWASLGRTELMLYRGTASEHALVERPPASFTSVTFSESVAQAHFAGGPATHSAALWRGRISIDRVLMTFLETAAMNDRFREAEAIVLGDPRWPPTA